MYKKKHLSIQHWGHAYTDHIIKSNFMGSVHSNQRSPHELWTGEKPDLNKSPLIPFGSIVMAHIPLALQNVESGRSKMTYCIGTSLVHNQGLILWNPETKKSTIRRTFKMLGPNREEITVPQYELTETGQLIDTTVTTNLEEVSHTIEDYNYLIGTKHRDDEDMEVYQTTTVVKEPDEQGDLILL